MPELYITDDEASMLAAVLAYVAGSPTNSPREHERSLYKKLDSLGYKFTHGKAEEFHALIKGESGRYPGLVFEDYKEEFTPGYYRDFTDGEVRLFDCEPDTGYWTRVRVLDAEDGTEYNPE